MMIKTLTSVLLAIKKEESRKSVKRAVTSGGFLKIPIKKAKSQTHAMSVNIMMLGEGIVTIVIWLPVALDVMDRMIIGSHPMMTTTTTNIRSK